MLARYVKISFALLLWGVGGTLLCTSILSRVQYIENGSYLPIPPHLIEAPVRHFFPDTNNETLYDIFWFSYVFIHLAAISVVAFAGYCAYKYLKKAASGGCAEHGETNL